MFDKLKGIYEEYETIRKKLIQPDVVVNFVLYSELNKSLKKIEPIVVVYEKYLKKNRQLEDDKLLLNSEKDEDIREMIKEDLVTLENELKTLVDELKSLLVPKDPNDDKNAILEIRAGTGGDEAGIFVGDIFRMYCRYAEKIKWKMSIVESIESGSGGYKEIVCNIMGNEVYGRLKFESGVHRVQRVPSTETQGRIHTSAISVVVLPEVDEVDVNLNMMDVRKDTFCSSGAGGQSVNTTYSAIRLTHIPTGIVVSCQDERSQMKNFDKALKVLRARLYELELRKQTEDVDSQRKSMVKSGDRSDKIRTYNYPQGRVTDHRIGLTLYNLPAIMDGNIDELVEGLRIADISANLQGDLEG
ncbi:MAG: peptide chain release factor 1 [Cytophagales bacterium]|nr:peptide chain release factor 1 [Cytophagales bacterium]